MCAITTSPHARCAVLAQSDSDAERFRAMFVSGIASRRLKVRWVLCMDGCVRCVRVPGCVCLIVAPGDTAQPSPHVRRRDLLRQRRAEGAWVRVVVCTCSCQCVCIHMWCAYVRDLCGTVPTAWTSRRCARATPPTQTRATTATATSRTTCDVSSSHEWRCVGVLWCVL
jgi:hypothetical protein